MPTLVGTGGISEPVSLYVNSGSGRDELDRGSVKTPFKTITYALERARSKTTIYIDGDRKYDTATGEIFPLNIPPGVVLTRNPVETSGKDMATAQLKKPPVIEGGAIYDIPESSGGRYATVIAGNNARISGIHFSLMNSPGHTGVGDGTAIMCDSSSPDIYDNTFSGTGHAGVTLLGTAHPVIQDNTFSGNINWGITAYGRSYPTIQSNKFSTKGGVDCTDQSHPIIEKNSFSCSSLGISTKGSSYPTILDNTVKGSGDYGIIVRMDSTPVIQGNAVTQNPVGIYVATTAGLGPDIGGGPHSTGKNSFDNYEWDIQMQSSVDINAQMNLWKSSCCEDIQAKIYDKKDNPLYGTVLIGDCIMCNLLAPGDIR
jgi:parallel beta-helix repeat protein